tara:strand:- start:625 stop:945 length:321 start_codon:yes stop_codon:yes gene_type:complete
MLCADQYGRALLKKHPEWVDKFDAKALFTSIPPMGMSAACFLYGSSDGQALLKTNPKLGEKINFDTIRQGVLENLKKPSQAGFFATKEIKTSEKECMTSGQMSKPA